MKNIPLIIFFSIISLLSLAVLIVLALLPKLCFCFTSFCDKNYQTVKKQNTRARRIKRARLRVLYKSQISHEKPIQIELDRSEGLFFDKESNQKIKDKESLESFYSGQYKASFLSGLLITPLTRLFTKTGEKISLATISNFKPYKSSLIFVRHHFDRLFSSVGVNSKISFSQVRSNVTSSVSKYLNH